MLNINAEVMADAAAIAVRLERIAMRSQHEADNDADVEWAKELRRHAKGLRNAIEQWVAKTPPVGAPST